MVLFCVAAEAAEDSDGYANLTEGKHWVYMSMPDSDDAVCRIE